MTKTSAKRWLIIVVPIVLILSFVTKSYWSNRNTVKYQIDTANSCQWRDGQIVGGTEAAQKFKTVHVKYEDEKRFFTEAQSQSECIYKR